MFLSKLKILRSHGIQYIKKLDTPVLPAVFRGRPEIAADPPASVAAELFTMCPSGAILGERFAIDLGKCVFCNECALRYPQYVKFTNDYRMATNVRERLVIDPGSPEKIELDGDAIRSEIYRCFGHALKLRQVSAGGDNSTEMELNASGNVNFDLGRYGIEFTASPRHADGIVITGPITENMAVPLELCYNAAAHPKLVILAGTDAVSGGLFADSPALDRSFLDRFGVDLYVPGNPVHPLTFIHGVMDLVKRKFR